jgi:hypothetical protein
MSFQKGDIVSVSKCLGEVYPHFRKKRAVVVHDESESHNYGEVSVRVEGSSYHDCVNSDIKHLNYCRIVLVEKKKWRLR